MKITKKVFEKELKKRGYKLYSQGVWGRPDDQGIVFHQTCGSNPNGFTIFVNSKAEVLAACDFSSEQKTC